MKLQRFLKELWIARKTLIFILTPFVFLPLALRHDSRESRCAYGLALMAVYWITETLPISVTALLPVVLFPLLGVLPVKAVTQNYMKDTSMFGLGCLSFAIAVEQWNLHKRIALRTLLFMGSDPKWLMLGFMLPTWFLSMWVNNTSATAIMIPIVDAVLQQLRESEAKGRRVLTSHDGGLAEMNEDSDDIIVISKKDNETSVTIERDHVIGREHDSPSFRRLCKGMSLCVAYAANIGGTGSLSGSSTNLVLKGQVDLVFQRVGLESGMTFTTWIMFALPGSIISLLLAWTWLSVFFLGKRTFFSWRCRRQERDAVMNTIRQQYTELGPVSFAEKGVIFHFFLLISLWFSRKPPALQGWGTYFPYVGDSMAAILVCVSMFIFPAEMPRIFCLEEKRGKGSVPSLLNWQTVQRNYPWGVLLLLGGGFALANACDKSGLSRWIGGELTVLKVLDPWLMNLLLTVFIALCTEITSNAATASVLLPVMAQLAVELQVNPLYLMWTCGICTSFAFMLPVATPPNAIVFANGYLEVKDMIAAGSVMNVICVLVLNLAVNTWGKSFFDFDIIPQEFLRNSTSVLNSTTFIN